ncbi:MAG TPA: trypsin-like serine protease [Chloroflexia bacterium]|jgi:secreted trypsin-like serine protease
MLDFTQILAVVEELEQRLDQLKDELGRIQAQAGVSEAEFGSSDVVPRAAAVIPPTSPPIEVIGGEETDQFPDCCAVGGDAGYYCSGTLIAPRVVVTADHCEDVPRGYHITRVFLGGSDIYQPGQGETVPVLEQFSHPEVDLRVLVLERAATVKHRPVADVALLSGATHATVVGFGNVDRDGSFGYGRKLRAEVPITTPDCAAVGDAKEYGCLPGREIVAGHTGLQVDSCTGDSGGPLYLKANGDEYFLVGVTSRGQRSASTVCGDGGIYVRVDLYLDWIHSVTGMEIGDLGR